ncbi:DUF4169 family protein [Rhodobacterales bacterium HKCCE4037]|nr:DUF4169 family protein [Rhodobacterales bacterium HKCCE4037]
MPDVTGKVVNLNRARKSRARDAERRKADVNAAKFGRTKAEKRAEALRAGKAEKDLDGHKRDE